MRQRLHGSSTELCLTRFKRVANKHLSLLVENEDWLQEGLQRLKPQALLSEESKKHTAKGVRKCRTCRRFRLGHFGRWQSTLGGALHTCHKGICEDFCEATGSCMAAELRLGTPGCSSIQLQPLTTARPLPVPLSQRRRRCKIKGFTTWAIRAALDGKS